MEALEHLQSARDELGIPGPETPQPVVNALDHIHQAEHAIHKIMETDNVQDDAQAYYDDRNKGVETID